MYECVKQINMKSGLHVSILRHICDFREKVDAAEENVPEVDRGRHGIKCTCQCRLV